MAAFHSIRTSLYSATVETPFVLGTWNGSTGIVPRGINDYGVITGQSGPNAVRWETGTGAAPAALNPLLVGPLGRGYRINSFGQVVGQAFVSGVPLAALWTPNGIGGYTRTDVGLPGARGSTAYGINSRGQVVGNSAFGTGTAPVDKCFLWTPASDNATTGTVEEISLGGNACGANDINDAGQIVGTGNTTLNGTLRAFVSDGSVSTMLSSEYSSAIAINNAGQVAGARAGTATVWNSSATGWAAADITVPALSGQTGSIASTSMDINDAGFVVGTSRDVNGVYRAFFWNAGEVVEISTLGPGQATPAGMTNVIEDKVIVTGVGFDPSTGASGLRWTISLTPLVTEGCSERLGRLIDELMAASSIDAGTATSLTAKLKAAERQAGAGKPIPAAKILNALMEEIDALERSGRLTAGGASMVREATTCTISEL